MKQIAIIILIVLTLILLIYYSRSKLDHSKMENTSYAARMTTKHPDLLQLYSFNTPNGVKVAAALEELVVLKGEDNFNYEPHSVDLRHGENRTKDFTRLTPNCKIPVIIDPNGPNGETIKLFESGAILLYLADRYDDLIPRDSVQRLETLQWLFWGSSSFSTQFKSFGFYYKYCTHNLPYCVERYTKECHRLLGVLEKQLVHRKHWVVGDMYTIADISIWPWLNQLYETYDNAGMEVFNDLKSYPLVREWYLRCISRQTSKNSLYVCPFIDNTKT